jgi:2-polyprenyl-3-methyl-5-hydroxy-6-metoxy-1,4-benzoquinol methylase
MNARDLMSTQEQFWSSYYAEVVKTGDAWLDYSNERGQAQIFGLALEGAGPISARSCVDIGCGWGQFSRSLSALRASRVTGVDIVPEMIAQHRREHPHIRWLCGSLQSPDLLEQLGSYDIAFVLEVLQYVPLAEVLDAIWERLLPGGRIVGVVPNADCPIVSRTRARFGTNYAPPSLHRIDAVVQAWGELEHAAYRGLSFGSDQRLAPYEVSSWRTSRGWEAEPNRIQFVAIKRGDRSARR